MTAGTLGRRERVGHSHGVHREVPAPRVPQQGYVLDGSLSGRLAEVLRLLGWDVVAVDELWGADRRTVASDQEVLRRCVEDQRVWVTADESLARQRAVADLADGASVLWLVCTTALSATEELAILAGALPRFDRRLTRAGHPLHCRATEGPRVRVQSTVPERRLASGQRPPR